MPLLAILKPLGMLLLKYKPLIYKLLFWIFLSFVAFVMLIEVTPKPMRFPLEDKLQHMIIFALLGGFGWLAYPKFGKWLWLSLGIFGGAIELAQSLFTLTRTGSALDWLADLAGLALALALIPVVLPMLTKLQLNPNINE